MTQYVYVQNNQIIEGPRTLPKSWGDTSGFDLLPQTELAAKGWLPWIVDEQPTFDRAIQKAVSSIVFNADSVEVTYTVVDLTPEEIEAVAVASAGNVRDITKRQFMLQAKAEGLWTTIKAIIASDQDVQDLYDATAIISRDDPMVVNLAAAINKTPAEVDAFFRAAYNL